MTWIGYFFECVCDGRGPFDFRISSSVNGLATLVCFIYQLRCTVAQGCACEHFEAPWELLGRPLTSLGTVALQPGVRRCLLFTTNCRKAAICIFRHHPDTELLPLTVELSSMVTLPIYFHQFDMVAPAFCNGAFPKAPKAPLQESTSATVTNSSFLKLR